MAKDSILDINKILDSYAKEIAKDVTTDAEEIAKKGLAEEVKVVPCQLSGGGRGSGQSPDHYGIQ